MSTRYPRFKAEQDGIWYRSYLPAYVVFHSGIVGDWAARLSDTLIFYDLQSCQSQDDCRALHYQQSRTLDPVRIEGRVGFVLYEGICVSALAYSCLDPSDPSGLESLKHN